MLDQIKFNITNIKELSFSVDIEGLNESNLKDVSLSTRFFHTLLLNENRGLLEVIIEMQYKYKAPESDEEKQIGFYKGLYQFEIDEIRKYFVSLDKTDQELSKFSIEPKLLKLVGSLAISGIRGMAALRFSNSFLSPFFLPLITLPDYTSNNNPIFELDKSEVQGKKDQLIKKKSNIRKAKKLT